MKKVLLVVALLSVLVSTYVMANSTIPDDKFDPEAPGTKRSTWVECYIEKKVWYFDEIGLGCNIIKIAGKKGECIKGVSTCNPPDCLDLF